MIQKPWLVFDMDDVLVDLSTHIEKHLNTRTGKNISKTDWYTFNLGEIYDIDSDSLYDMFFETSMLETTKMTKSIADTLIKAKTYYKVGILTARGWHPDAYNITQNMLLECDVVVDKLHIVAHHEKKEDAITQHFQGHIAGFVDDNIAHVKGVHEKGIEAWILTQPWNSTYTHPNRVAHINDFIAYTQARRMSFNQNYSD